jgi:regulator of protease activity HflC (stomatin/prohibitin superfamily)
VVITILERLCKHSKDNTRFVSAILSNCRVFFTILSVQTVLAAVCVIVEVLQLVNIQKYIGYIYTGIFFYYVAFVTLSLLIILMRKELAVAPYIHVPVPFVKREIDGQEKSFVEYLEENTGITLRSLWSIKYIRDITPAVVFLIAVLLWLSTCIIQVETNQQAAVYRIGNLQEKILKPGLHLTLPYPFDKVEIYDTETVNKTTIGYKATDNSDNIWTEGHQGEEYKLLLGGGDEVVSINLRLEYKISDLKQYLTTATSPESMMQALAYELVTDQTIATDLSSLMSADRDAFSENFQKELAKMMEEKNLGLEVVAVILESIHPPVEIAWVYQELISAGINAEKYLVNAQDVAAVTIAQAETTHDTTVGGAQVSYEEKVAAAKASVTEFMASVEAYNASSDAYKYQKYLAAVRKAYGNANLVILGEGVDQSAIYFGNIAGNSGNSASGNLGNSSNSNSNSKSGSNSTNSSGNSNTQQ